MTNDIELQAINRQQQRFSWLSIATMLVSFVHMVAALALFSDGTYLGNIAAILMTGLVDAATWVITGYLDYSKRRNLKRNWLIKGLLGFALAISFGLNLAYMLAHMPPADKVPQVISVGIAIVLSIFIPLCIGVASLARGELEDDKTQQLAVAVASQERNQVLSTPPHVAPRILSIKRPQSMLAQRPERLLAAPVGQRKGRKQSITDVQKHLTLDDRATEIVRLRDEEQLTFTQIGERYGFTRQAASAIYNGAKHGGNQ
jgi:uncharacterized membrane protein (DUF485 family)